MKIQQGLDQSKFYNKEQNKDMRLSTMQVAFNNMSRTPNMRRAQSTLENKVNKKEIFNNSVSPEPSMISMVM